MIFLCGSRMESSTQRYGGITLKKNTFSGLSTLFGLLFAVLAMTSSAVALAGPSNCNGTDKQHIVVHLKSNLEDLQAALIATRLGSLMAGEGCQVTLFLTLRGVRLADNRMPQNLDFGRDDVGAPNLADAVASFQANGGTVAVCPACAGEIGLSPADLIPGATILDGAGLVDLFLTADKIIDF